MSRERLELEAERVATYLMATLVAYVFIQSIYNASVRPFWFDELCTWVVVKQGGLRGIWSALSHHVDGQPPFFYIVTWAATWFVPKAEISYRLLSIIGFCGTLVCVFLFAKRRAGAIVGLSAGLILCLTQLFHDYSVEARPYALLTAFFSLAILAYDHLPSRGWTVVLGLSLALAQAVHSYAILLSTPFLAVELAHAIRRREFRGVVWVALLATLLPLIAAWPILSGFRAYYGTNFWAKAHYPEMYLSYGWMFHTNDGITIRDIFYFPVLAVLVKGFLVMRRVRTGGYTRLSMSVYLLAILFVTLPLLLLAETHFAHMGVTPRYALPALLGYPIAFTILWPREGLFYGKVLALFLIAYLVVKEESFARRMTVPGRLNSASIEVEGLIESAQRPELPVVISDAHDFLPLIYYGTANLRQRCVALADSRQELKYLGSDSSSLELATFPAFLSADVQGTDAFVAAHNEFLLYSSDGGMNRDWWPRRFHEDGFNVRAVAANGLKRIFLVTRPNTWSRVGGN